MNIEIISTRLGDIEYCSVGKGTPVLFIHGGHSNCQETLCHKGFNLEKYQLITPSRPGYGKTPLNGKKTPKLAADLIEELLNHLSVDKVIAYGISAGGLTAIELAAIHPNRVSKLILASAVSKKWLDKNEKIYKTAQILFSPKVEKITWKMVRYFSRIFPSMMAKSFYQQFSKRPIKNLNEKDIQDLISSIRKYHSGKGFLNDLDQNSDDSSLAKIKCPTLIIHSKNDNSVPFEHALHAREMIDNSSVVQLDNEWGHLFWLGKDSMNSINNTIKFIEA